jgi:hypothetical protein
VVNGNHIVTILLQDLNFVGRRIRLPPAAQERFIAAIQTDVTFLRSKNIIDYSILLGISTAVDQWRQRRQRDSADEEPNPSFWTRASGGIAGRPADSQLDLAIAGWETTEDVYFFGVVDILQEVCRLHRVLSCFEFVVGFLSVTFSLLFCCHIQYNLNKKLEHCLKSGHARISGDDPQKLSVIASSLYANRFLRYITSLLE